MFEHTIPKDSTLAEYMAREPLVLDEVVIDETTINVRGSATSFVYLRLIPRIDIEGLARRRSAIITRAREQGVSVAYTAKTKAKIDALRKSYAPTYERYVSDFGLLAFLWRAKVDSGIRYGCRDDRMINEVLFPLQWKLQERQGPFAPLYDASELNHELSDLERLLDDGYLLKCSL